MPEAEAASFEEELFAAAATGSADEAHFVRPREPDWAVFVAARRLGLRQHAGSGRRADKRPACASKYCTPSLGPPGEPARVPPIGRRRRDRRDPYRDRRARLRLGPAPSSKNPTAPS